MGAVRPDAGVIAPRGDGGFDLDDNAEQVAAAAAVLAPGASADPDPARTLLVLAAAVVGERRSKQLVYDQGCIAAAAHFLDPDAAAALAATAAGTVASGKGAAASGKGAMASGKGAMAGQDARALMLAAVRPLPPKALPVAPHLNQLNEGRS